MKITNRQKTHQVLNITEHADTCPKDCLCEMVTTTLNVEMEDGTPGLKVLERRLAGSVTFLGGETKELPDWVAESKAVKDGVAKGRLRLVKE